MLRLRRFSYRFAEQVLNSKLALKEELESFLSDPGVAVATLSRQDFNEALKVRFTARGWESQPAVFTQTGDPAAKMDFLKERIGVEVEFGHPSFLGIDVLKFQVASYSGLDKIDVGVYVTTTADFQKRMRQEYGQKWKGSITYEKVVRYLPHFKSAIQVPIYVLGIDL